MKPVDRRRLITALHRGCRARGLELVEDPDAGAGSHGSLVFVGPTDTLRLVIVYAREVSPGVQRAMLRYVEQQVEARRMNSGRSLAQSVLELLRECLG